MEREEMIRLAKGILAGSFEEAEMEAAVCALEDAVGHPAVSGLFFYPDQWGLTDDPSAEEVIDAAMSWTGRVCAMRVEGTRKLRVGSECCLVDLTGGPFTGVCVLHDKALAPGAVLAVALSGVVLPDGRRATHGFVDGAYSMGFIIEATDAEPGTDLTESYGAELA